MNWKTPRNQGGSSSPLLFCSEAACFSFPCSPGSGVCFWTLSPHRQAFPNLFAHGPLTLCCPKMPAYSQSPHLIPARHPLIQPPRFQFPSREHLTSQPSLWPGTSWLLWRAVLKGGTRARSVPTGVYGSVKHFWCSSLVFRFPNIFTIMKYFTELF